MALGRRPWLLTGILAGLLLTTQFGSADRPDRPDGRGVAGLAGGLVPSPDRPFDQRPYSGHGAWVDVFDYLPVMQGGSPPPITPDSVEEMAAAGIDTLYLQAAFDDARTPGRLTDEDLLARFVVRAHANEIDVVGWYLPRFANVDVDLRHLLSIDRFEVGGHRFDGLAVDIEFTDDVPDPAIRNPRLIELSDRLYDRTGGPSLGAIVLPPVLTEVVNPASWPDFPWLELADAYDVWLPMSYWTTGNETSEYRNGFTYNTESTRRLRTNLENPNAVVHGIGGIGDETTPESLTEFARSLEETGSIGGSIYDWATLDQLGRDAMTEAFAAGRASDLPSP